MSFFKTLFGTGDTVGSIERVAREWIETKQETAEANALMVKTLDPNGMMRRELSRRVRDLYTLYILIALTLIVMESFGLGNQEGVKAALDRISDLFLPITTMFTTIVGASFGVNAMNVHKNNKQA